LKSIGIAQEFDAALEQLYQMDALQPGQLCVSKMIKRIMELKASGVPANWTGVAIMDTK
jgi:DNA-binding MltR family transcriptional regulator